MAKIIDGRQVAPTAAGIREDHRVRYQFAAEILGEIGTVIDAGCGCGYGAAMLAESCRADVTAIDNSRKAIAYAREHYSRDGITWRNVSLASARLPDADAIVAFEVIEHVEDPVAMLKKFAAAAPVLIGSVPNETVVPFATANNPYHHRHFTRAELAETLAAGGWDMPGLFGQDGKTGAAAAVTARLAGDEPRTWVFTATRK